MRSYKDRGLQVSKAMDFWGQFLPGPKVEAPDSTHFPTPGNPGPVLSWKAQECRLLKDACLCLLSCLDWLSVSWEIKGGRVGLDAGAPECPGEEAGLYPEPTGLFGS